MENKIFRWTEVDGCFVVVIVIILKLSFGSIGENWSCVRVPFSALSEILFLSQLSHSSQFGLGERESDTLFIYSIYPYIRNSRYFELVFLQYRP